MGHASLRAALRARLDEINEQLAPFKLLLKEREHIVGLLDLHGTLDETQVPFTPDPNSRTARVLAVSRELLEQEPTRQTSFIKLFHQIPKEVVGDGRHAREHVRSILLRAGSRAGIIYESKDVVKLAA